MNPREKLSTFFLRLNMKLSERRSSKVSIVVKPLEMLCKPYSNEKSKNMREIFIPNPAIRLKLMGRIFSSKYLYGDCSKVWLLKFVSINFAFGPI